MSPKPESEMTPEELALAKAEAKRQAKFFAAVRARGVLNHMLDGPVERYEKANPGMRARWEYCDPKGDTTQIVYREGMGFKLVQMDELGELQPSEKTEGNIKVGDLILMAAPEYIVDAIEMADAKAAWDDWKLPETSYKENLSGIRVKTRSGEVIGPEAVGDLKTHQEVLTATPSAGTDHEVEP